MTTPHDDIPASGSRNVASLTTNEAEKSVLTNASFSSVAQTTQRVHPRAAEAQGNRQTKVRHQLTAIEEETHPPLVQAVSTDEVWHRQGNPKSRWGFTDERPTIVDTNKGVLDTSAESGCSPIFGVQVGTDTYALRTEPGTVNTPPKTCVLSTADT
jgi:hypothetical protein